MYHECIIVQSTMYQKNLHTDDISEVNTTLLWSKKLPNIPPGSHYTLKSSTQMRFIKEYSLLDCNNVVFFFISVRSFVLLIHCGLILPIQIPIINIRFYCACVLIFIQLQGDGHENHFYEDWVVWAGERWIVVRGWRLYHWEVFYAFMCQHWLRWALLLQFMSGVCQRGRLHSHIWWNHEGPS